MRRHPALDAGPWEALAGMDTSEAIAQRNTAHKATQDSRSEAGMTGEERIGGSAEGADGTPAQQRRHPVLRHGVQGGVGEDGHQRGNSATQYRA